MTSGTEIPNYQGPIRRDPGGSISPSSLVSSDASRVVGYRQASDDELLNPYEFMEGSPYSGQPMMDPPIPDNRFSRGVVGLLMVAVAMIGFFVCSYLYFGNLMTILGPNGISEYGMTFTQEQLTEIPIAPVIGLVFATILGVSGFGISISALIKNHGKLPAIVGVVLGIIAPFGFILAAALATISHSS